MGETAGRRKGSDGWTEAKQRGGKLCDGRNAMVLNASSMTSIPQVKERLMSTVANVNQCKHTDWINLHN